MQSDARKVTNNLQMNFSSLGLSEKVLSAVDAAGYKTPTPIQSGAIPYVLERRDVLGIAQTGTGKTASFTLPMLSMLEHGRARARMPRTIILEPTRELASQVKDNFDNYGVNHRLNVALLIGGVPFEEQNKIIDRGADVLIATPGRLIDHVENGGLILQGVEILVIDEADRMLDMGFIPEVERISKLVPPNRQTLFFSATMPPEIIRLVNQFLKNPAKVEVAPPATTAITIIQKLVAADSQPAAKREKLRELIRGAEDLKNAIIFCNRKKDVEILYRSLTKHKFSVCCLHGDMDQISRMDTLESFKGGKFLLLVASDVAARGLDLPEVSHVFNFDTPAHADYYVHRVGRTGRAGRTGKAYMIVTREDEKHLKSIQKLIKTELEWVGEKTDFSKRTQRAKNSKGKAGKTKKSAPAVSTPVHSASNHTKQVPEVTAPMAQTPKPTKEKAPTSQVKKLAEVLLGFGEHTPAFILRSVPLRKSAK